MRFSKKIHLNLNQVKDFVYAASACDFDVDIANDNHNRYIVDAKSLLGVMGLNFRDNMIVSYNGRNEKFEHVLAALAPAG